MRRRRLFVRVSPVTRQRDRLGDRRTLVALLLLLLCVPSVVRAQSESVEYYGTDALGSVRVVFDANGNILARMDYGPFGQELMPSTGKQQGIYAGLFADGEAGLDHAEARSYQVRTGRLNSVDPVYDGSFEPQRWNRYAYAINNPITFTDSTGLDPCKDPTPGMTCFGSSNNPAPSPYSAAAMTQMTQWWVMMFGPGGYVEKMRSTGTTVSTTTGTGQTPTPPPDPPPSPPPTPPPGPPNDCKSFASEISVMSAAAVGSEDSVGWQMMLAARSDPWHRRGVSGFKGSLTRDQGPDVYRHIFAHAGGVLATRSGGGVAVNYEFAKDVYQWFRGKYGAPTEVRDDIAGGAVGAVMMLGRRNVSWVTKHVTRILCE